MDGPPAKRRKLAVVLSSLAEFYRHSWGKPLDPGLTTLPKKTTDLDGDSMVLDDDVLPGDPFLNVLETRFLVRSEYIRVFEEVEELFKASHASHLAVVTGQPGIGALIFVL